MNGARIYSLPEFPQIILDSSDFWREVVGYQEVPTGTHASGLSRGASIGGAFVAKRWHKTSFPEHADRSGFCHIDDDGVLGFSTQNEGDNAVFTRVKFFSPTPLAVNRNAGIHSLILSFDGARHVVVFDQRIVTSWCNSAITSSDSQARGERIPGGLRPVLPPELHF